MYLRPNYRQKDGKVHTYWTLVESWRTEEGPRQRKLCYLGELNHSQQARWQKALEVFNEQGQDRQLKLFPADVPVADDDPEVARVLVKQVRVERVREWGQCWLGWELWKQLELDRFFQRHVDTDASDVPWSRIAAVLAINRLCAPGSELALEQRWFPITALDNLLAIPTAKLNDTRLYRCLDRLLPHKAALEQHLREKYGELFQAEFDVLLYDLTSTYLEGGGEKNPQMQRGYSRDHRPDCKQVVLALIVNPDGFPISYEVFDGHRADVTTLEEALETVEAKYGQARRVWVFDRGLVSEENLQKLREHRGQYLVGTPRSKLKDFDRYLVEEGWEQVRPEVEVKLVSTGEGEETYVLCRTTGRKEKEQAIHSRFSARLEKAFRSLEKRVATGKLKDRDKALLKLGRLEALHPQVADLYQWELAEANGKLAFRWCLQEDKRAWQELREGAYLLRTNLPAQNPAELWKQYMQLTEVEAAFRALKSELGIRPLYHQLESRVQAHILVAFLGYALWVTLKHWLRRQGTDLSPAKALALLKTLHSADIILPTTDGREIRLRRVSEPTTEQKKLLAQMGLSVPERCTLDQKCSVDSAVA
jgi:transposase